MKKLLIIITLIITAFVGTANAMDKFIVKDAWLRVAPNKVAGGFFEIHNQTDKIAKLIAASANGAQKIELHSHTMNDGIMKMRKEDSISVPANSVLSFNPHSYHLMMFKLDKQIFKVGEQVEITLTFEDKSTLSAKFQVLKFGQEYKPSMDHSKMNHDQMDTSKMQMPTSK